MQSCLTFTDGIWNESFVSLQRYRKEHTSWTRPDGRILLVGGDGSAARTETEVLLDEGTSEKNFTLPYPSRLF